MITDNAHSYVKANSSTLVLENDTTLIRIPELSENTRTGTLYAKLMPKKYAVTFSQGAENLLDNTLASATWTGNNLTVAYNASNRTYTLTNGENSDPYANINQWLNLEAGVEYMMHMDIASSTDKTNVQIFYAIDRAFSESNTRSFHSSSSTLTFTVPTSGKYWIRMDNDCGGNATISNFWVSKAHTESVEVYYNETLPTVTTPTSAFYNFAGYMYNGSVTYYSADGIAKQPYAVSGNVTLVAQWSQKYSGTYVKTESELKAIKNKTSANYYVINDITLASNWTPIDSFSGTLNGLGHEIAGLKYSYDSSNGEVTNFGMFRKLSGKVNNLVFSGVSIVITKTKDGANDNCVGTVAGIIEGGEVSNVTINYAYLDNTHYRDVVDSGDYVNSYVGGIAGLMKSGKISNCSILGGNIRSNAKKCKDKSDAHAFSGGILGRLDGGTITSCKRADAVVVYSYAEQDTGSNSGSAVRSAAGGIVGGGSSSSVTACTSSSSNLTADWTVGKTTASSSYHTTGALIGH
jgi:hypothetical protein